MKVTPETIFGEILEEYPASEGVLVKYLGAAYCLTCPGKMFDNIGNGAMIHGLSDEAMAEMVKDLQAVVDEAEGEHQKDEDDVPMAAGSGDHVGHDHEGHAHEHDHDGHDHGDHEGHSHPHQTEDDDEDLIV